MVELLPHLQGTLGFVPVVIQDYLGARANARRMEEFLKRAEQETVLSDSPSGSVAFRDASVAWPSEAKDELSEDGTRRFSLHSINLDFPVGELSIIHGMTGCGKSLLLAAMLGEVELLKGCIQAPSMTTDGKPAAFVPQNPWLQNTTLRDNILFGSPLKQDRYNQVLSACALYPDLEALPQGDETLIGLRGVKLSGGQRMRVALARALYSSASTLILDDILSSLDSHVSREVFNALTGDLCKDRTRILVTHQVSLCLPKAKYVVQIQNNTAYAGAGSITSMVEPKDDKSDPDPPVEKPSNVTVKRDSNEGKTQSRLNSRSDLKVYKAYFAAAGGITFVLTFVLGLVVKQLLHALTTWTLGRINSAREADHDLGLQQYLYLYLLTSLLCVGWSLRMPLLWLDTTPIGEMLKRFTADMKMVDTQVLSTMSELADCLVQMLIIISVGISTSKYTTFLTVALVYASMQVGQRYLAARTTVRRADSTADILECFTSSVSGVSTIRAFGAVDLFTAEMHRLIDRMTTTRRHFWIFNRWLGLQMSLIAILFTTGTGVILLSKTTVIDASVVGFTLTFSMRFSGALFRAANASGELEAFMDAARAVTTYAELETEKQDGVDVPDDWPCHGEIEVRGLNIAYANHLPLVLKDVSFTARAGQRVGIVWRTGAGKSSLTLALLRLIEPRDGGIILIDGIDISTVKVQSLRSRIGFIPQDPVLFSGTIRSNLDYFQEMSEERLEEALRRVGLLRQGDDDKDLFTLDSAISAGGANLSQGQRQLLCLARLLIQDSKIVILDEAMSAVDNSTDLRIQETLRREISGTLVVVAHRLRTIVAFDQVVVISEGRIAERGRPADVYMGGGIFADLVGESGDSFVAEALATSLSSL